MLVLGGKNIWELSMLRDIRIIVYRILVASLPKELLRACLVYAWEKAYSSSNNQPESMTIVEVLKVVE